MNASDLASLVKQSIDIVDVVGQVVPLRRSGSRHVGLCPFHKEKTPSFQVDSNSQLYHCFGCGVGGDVLSFVMKHQNLPFGDAVRVLADRYHVALPVEDTSLVRAGGATEAVRKEKEELYQVLQLSTDFFYTQLHDGEPGRTAREYLEKRGLPSHVVEAERMGYAPAEWDRLSAHLRRSGVDVELGIKAGLLARSTKEASRVYDRFRNRLIFPIRDDRKRVVGFGGRSLSPDTRDEPKYLNSPETLVYQKGRMLYQLARAREACREIRQVVLVEGYMDLLAFHAQGFHRVVATLGTALTAQQVRLLARMADEVVFAYDADEAGEKAMIRGLPLFFQEEVPVSCVRFPLGMDPDDFLRKEGLSAFESLVKKREDLGALAIRKVLDRWDGSATGKALVLTELQPLFAVVRQPLLRSEYLRQVSERLVISEKTIERQWGHGQKRAFKADLSHPAARPPQEMGDPSLEERIVRLMIKYPELVEEVKESHVSECFQEPRLKAIAEVLMELSPEGLDSVNAAAVYDSLPDDGPRELYTRLLLEASEMTEARVHMKDWLQALLDRELRIECSGLREALHQHKGEFNQTTKCLLARIQELRSGGKK